jgi:hypothetical protein
MVGVVVDVVFSVILGMVSWGFGFCNLTQGVTAAVCASVSMRM